MDRRIFPCFQIPARVSPTLDILSDIHGFGADYFLFEGINMKPWVVVKWPRYHINFGIPGVLGMAVTEETTERTDYNMNEYGNHMYFCDTKDNAMYLANKLAVENVGVTYIVAKSTETFVAKPGPIKMGQFTDEGYLPV